MKDKKHRHSASIAVPPSASVSSPTTTTTSSSTAASRRQSTPLHRTAATKSPNSGEPVLPRPASLVRVKEQTAMNIPPIRTSDMALSNDQLSRKGTSGRPETPATPGSSRRSGTPDTSATSIVNPSSSLLQDLLKEQRASRGSRGSTPVDGETQVPPTPDRSRRRLRSQSHSQSQSQYQDEVASERQRKVNTALSAGLRQPREMGVREMDHYVSKMNKQNFDLKLEIFHRAQQMTALEKKLARMEELEDEVQRLRGVEDELQELQHVEEDNQRLRESNDELRQELDNRDQAVTEAVDLICQLEAKLDELEGRGNGDNSRPSSADSSHAGADATPRQRKARTIEIPERTSSRQRKAREPRQNLAPTEPRLLQRAPSFLREENKSTAALRGLYVPTGGDPTQSVMSLITKSESMNSMNEAAEAASPRLSALSECSDLHSEEPLMTQHDDEEEDEDEDEDEEVGQVEMAGHEGASTAGSSDTVGLRQEEERRREQISKWIPPISSEISLKDSPKSPKRKNRASMFELSNRTPPEGDLNNNDPRQRVRVDNFFGRLPPTPDTMGTARAVRTDNSNGGSSSDQEQLEKMRHRLGPSQSSGELTAGQSSENSGKTTSFDSDLSDSSRDELADAKNESPSVRPANNSVVGAKNTAQAARAAKRHTVNLPSSSPPLTPQEWMDAANVNPRSRKEAPPARKPVRRETHSGTPPSSDLQSIARSSVVGQQPQEQQQQPPPQRIPTPQRRYSVDSAVRSSESSSPEPILDPAALEQDLKSPRAIPDDVSEASSRRLSMRPSFLNRLASSRRLQSSPGSDSTRSDSKDTSIGAPAPVVPKARNTPEPTEKKATTAATAATSSTTTTNNNRAEQQHSKGGNHKNLSTEPNMRPHKTAKSVVSNKEYKDKDKDKDKRRGSLGIFGWMIGAGSTASSSSRRTETSPPATTLQPHIAVRSRSSRPSPRSAGAAPHTPHASPASAQASPSTQGKNHGHGHGHSQAQAQAQAQTLKMNHPNSSSCSSSVESEGRRPRYVERRSRRG